MSALRNAGVFGGILGLTLFVGAAPAMAGAPLDRGTFHNQWTDRSTATDPEWDCAFDVLVSGDVRGHFRFGPRKPGGPDYGMEGVHGTITFSANGSSYVNVFSTLNKDTSVTVNTDGSLSVEVLATGNEKWLLDGVLLFHNPGRIRFELLITNPGTAAEKVEFVKVLADSTGLNNGPTREFCEDIEDFLGPDV